MATNRKNRKPCPGMGAFVVLTDIGEGKWCAYAGATTMEKARARKRELSHYPADAVVIIENVPGAVVPGIVAGYND